MAVVPIAQTAYFAGMRQGEILGLRRGQLDLGNRMIVLAPEDVKESDWKRVPIDRELVPILDNALKIRAICRAKVYIMVSRYWLGLLLISGRNEPNRSVSNRMKFENRVWLERRSWPQSICRKLATQASGPRSPYVGSTSAHGFHPWLPLGRPFGTQIDEKTCPRPLFPGDESAGYYRFAPPGSTGSGEGPHCGAKSMIHSSFLTLRFFLDSGLAGFTMERGWGCKATQSIQQLFFLQILVSGRGTLKKTSVPVSKISNRSKPHGGYLVESYRINPRGARKSLW